MYSNSIINNILKSDKIIYFSAFVFILLNAVLIYNQSYFLLLLPAIILTGLIIVISYDTLFYLIAFFTPLSLKISEFIPGQSFDLSIPTEPLLIILTGIFVLKLLSNPIILRKIVFHPVSITIYIYLAWIFITCLTSEMPLVSFKFLISRLWFIIPFFFMFSLIFTDIKKIKYFLWSYLIGFVIIILLSTYNFIFHYRTDNNVMHPFFNDHTAYGAAITMFIPVIGSLFILCKNSLVKKLSIGVLVVLFFIALFLSYSRAAWIGFAASLAFGFILYFKIKTRWILFTSLIVLIIVIAFRFQILDMLSKNKQDSTADVMGHVKSISNISTDASNMERINRWKCAFKLFAERPVFGWGPGTYQFVYGPYQMATDRTIISVNMGELGTAHSEYFGPLSESGFFGMISVFLIIFATIITGMQTYKKSKNNELKIIILGCLAGLVSYYTHGILNNFLDSDKLSIPFWGFTAIIVIINLKQKQQSTQLKQQ